MRFDPFGSLVGLAGCFVDWILTRSWNKVLLQFLPLVMAVSLGGLVAAGNWLSRDMLADRYLKLANDEVVDWEKSWAPVDPAADEEASSSTGDLENRKVEEIPRAAEMLFRRVQQLQQNDRRSVFFVAMSYIQQGKLQQGMTMLSRIAPDDAIGYLPAHAYMAEYHLARPIARKDLPVIRHHMLAAMTWDRASPQLLAAISQLLYSTDDGDKAIQAMQMAADRDPTFNLPLAKLSATSEREKPRAEESLKSAIKHFTGKLERNPHDIKARLLLVDSYCQNSDYVGAEKLLTEGMKLSDDPLLKTALSEVYCRTFISTSKLENNTWSGDIELLERAFRLDPNNLHIYEEVAKLARIGGASPHEGLMNQLRKNLAEGKATSITHTWIAEHYLINNQYEKAVPHLEQAVKRDPRASRCWNNLAYCVADRYPERLEDALKYADQALTIAPRVPDFHDTRGTVLMKMKRYADAVAAFEQAVEMAALSGGRFPDQPGYHQRLAEAYTGVGDAAMAKTHQELAAQLKVPRPAPTESAPTTDAASTEAPEKAAESSSDATAAESISASPTDAPGATEEKATESTTAGESVSDEPVSAEEPKRP